MSHGWRLAGHSVPTRGGVLAHGGGFGRINPGLTVRFPPYQTRTIDR